MDKDREIRFLYPPLVFLGSLLFGFITSRPDSLPLIVDYLGSIPKESATSLLITTVAGVGLTMLVLGFVLGTVTHVALRSLFKLFNREFEIELPSDRLADIWKAVVKPNRGNELQKREFRLPLAATFCHETLPKGTSGWLVRRWHAVNLSASSCSALVVAYWIGPCLGIGHSCKWSVFSGVLFVCFAINAFYAWKDTMKMYEFQSFRTFPKEGEPPTPTSP